MQHLSPEDLARLVEEPGGPEEVLHVRVCGDCRAELEALREQTAALRDLPALPAPALVWEGVEERLREEGLIAAPGPRRVRLSPVWRIAAALALFVGGGATGASLVSTFGAGEGASPPAVQAGTPTAAAEALRTAEAEYLAALARYAELSGAAESVDPANRLAALEGIVLTARAALREAPADPVINGYLLNALGQREAILRRISTSEQDAWF